MYQRVPSTLPFSFCQLFSAGHWFSTIHAALRFFKSFIHILLILKLQGTIFFLLAISASFCIVEDNTTRMPHVEVIGRLSFLKRHIFSWKSDKSFIFFLPDHLKGIKLLDLKAKSKLTMNFPVVSNTTVVNMIVSEKEKFAYSDWSFSHQKYLIVKSGIYLNLKPFTVG